MVITPVECDTSENVADIGTKALGPAFFAKHASMLVGKVSLTNTKPSIFMFGVGDSLPVSPGAPFTSVEAQTVDPDDCICGGNLDSRCGRPVPVCKSYVIVSPVCSTSSPDVSPVFFPVDGPIVPVLVVSLAAVLSSVFFFLNQILKFY